MDTFWYRLSRVVPGKIAVRRMSSSFESNVTTICRFAALEMESRIDCRSIFFAIHPPRSTDPGPTGSTVSASNLRPRRPAADRHVPRIAASNCRDKPNPEEKRANGRVVMTHRLSYARVSGSTTFDLLLPLPLHQLVPTRAFNRSNSMATCGYIEKRNVNGIQKETKQKLQAVQPVVGPPLYVRPRPLQVVI